MKTKLVALGTTVIGTFIGVFLGVYMNNLMTTNHEKQQLKAALELTKTEIKKVAELPNAMADDDSARIIEQLNFKKVDQPVLFMSLFSNNLFSKYCSPATTPLFYLKEHILDCLAIMNNRKKTIKQRVTAYRWYAAHLNHVEDLLRASLSIVDGKVTADQFDKLETALEVKHYIRPDIATNKSNPVDTEALIEGRSK